MSFIARGNDSSDNNNIISLVLLSALSFLSVLQKMYILKTLNINRKFH